MSVESHMINEIINNLRLVFYDKEYHPIMNNKKNFNILFNTLKALIVFVYNEGQNAKKQTESLLKDEETVLILLEKYKI